MKQIMAVMLLLIIHHLPAVAGGNYIVTIGQARYRQGIASLPVCEANAVDIAGILAERGFAPTVYHNLSREEFNAALAALPQQLYGASTLVIHYSGYILEAGGGTYLCPREVNRKAPVREILRQCIPLGALYDMVRNAHARSAYIIIDGCRILPVLRAGRHVRPTLLQELPDHTALYYAVCNSVTAYSTRGRWSRYSKWVVCMLDKASTIRSCLDSASAYAHNDPFGSVSPVCVEKLYRPAAAIAFAQQNE